MILLTSRLLALPPGSGRTPSRTGLQPFITRNDHYERMVTVSVFLRIPGFDAEEVRFFTDFSTENAKTPANTRTASRGQSGQLGHAWARSASGSRVWQRSWFNRCDGRRTGIDHDSEAVGWLLTSGVLEQQPDLHHIAGIRTGCSRHLVAAWRDER